MPFTIIISKKWDERHSDDERYFIKDLLGFATKDDLDKFKQSKANVALRFKKVIPDNMYFRSKEYQAELVNSVKLKLNDHLIQPKIEKNKVDYNLHYSVTFNFNYYQIDQLIEKGFFNLLGNDGASNTLDLQVEFLLNYKNQNYNLGSVYLHRGTARMGYRNDVSWLIFHNEIWQDEYRYGLFNRAKHLAKPMGCVTTDNDILGFEVSHFAPDETFAIVKRTVENDVSLYTFISPPIIQEQLKNEGEIAVSNLTNQLYPAKKVYNLYDQYVIVLPPLFMGPSCTVTYKIDNNKYGMPRIIAYNSQQIREIHLDEEAREIWIKRQQALPENKTKSVHQLKTEAKQINCHIERTEQNPLRFSHDPAKDLLAGGTIRRDFYKDDYFIHLSSLTHNIPKPVTLYEALPDELRKKFAARHFCWIQYNASETVPRLEDQSEAIPGFSTLKNQPLRAGLIHNLGSLNDLKDVELQSHYGGSYYVLAACTSDYISGNGAAPPAPELWTVFTEGKDWTGLMTKDNKWVTFPYKINY